MREYRTHSQALVERLSDPGRAQQYLDVALEEYQTDGDLAGFLLAVRRVAEAQGGLGRLSKQTSLNRANLYSALSEEGNPRFETVSSILNKMGFQLSLKPAGHS